MKNLTLKQQYELIENIKNELNNQNEKFLNQYHTIEK